MTSIDPDDSQGLPEPMRQQQARWLARAERAQAQAAQAFSRLLDLAAGDTVQAGRVAQCLDASPWRKTEPHRLVPGGDVRVQAAISAWGLKPQTWS